MPMSGQEAATYGVTVSFENATGERLVVHRSGPQGVSDLHQISAAVTLWWRGELSGIACACGHEREAPTYSEARDLLAQLPHTSSPGSNSGAAHRERSLTFVSSSSP